MAIITVIDVSTANSGLGDPLRDGGVIINTNFANLNTDKLETGGYAGNAQNLADLIAVRTAQGGYVGSAQDIVNLISAISYDVVITTIEYTPIDHKVVLCDASGGAFDITLDLASAQEDSLIIIKKIDSSANAITVVADVANTIDGQLTQTLTSQFDAITIISDGVSTWHII